MQSETDVRVREIGCYIAEYGATVRSAAERFGCSKSTVHKYMTERLAETDLGLYERVRSVLDKNKAERHIRGGEATKQKYLLAEAFLQVNSEK